MAKSKVKRYANEGYVTSEDSNSGMKEAYDDAQAESRGEEVLKGMRDEEAATVSRAKPKIVTKEELAKSGLSLRDYMNQQQGLTRRGGSSAPVTPTATAPAATKETSSGMSFKDKITKEAADAIKASGKKYPDMSVLQAPAKRAGMTAMGRKSSSFDDFGSGDGYKKGGMTRSSASNRADGIATKGHTKGKYL